MELLILEEFYRAGFLMLIKHYANFWNMWKNGAVHLSPYSHIHAHIPRSHVKRPGLSLGIRVDQYIPDGSTTQLKRVI
jgi:hypothetical protein